MYSWPDLARSRDLVWHEYTHAVLTYDVTDITGKWDFSHPFKEALAMWWPAAVLGDPDSSCTWPGAFCRPLDPKCPASSSDPACPAGEERDRAVPYDLCAPNGFATCVKDEDNPGDSTWWYADGGIWSEFLWDLRVRTGDLARQLPTLGIDEHVVEALQFEAVTRMDSHVEDFTESLEALFDADAAVTGRQASYEILSSAARHGIKLDRAIAVAEPSRFVFEQRSDGSLVEIPKFTVYSGANDNCLLEFATEASLFEHPEGFESDPRYALARCSDFPTCFPGVIRATLDSSGSPRDFENRKFTCSIPDTALSHLLESDPRDKKIILYKVTTTGIGGTLDGVIRGAGITYKDPDLPAIFIVPVGELACGACAATGSKGGDMVAALLALSGVLFVRLRRSWT